MAGAYGLYELDTDSLEKNPNLKFDPQNPSAFLNPDHPNFQKLKEGLTPEQIQILEQISTVDGFDIDEKDHIDDDEEITFIDPDTGEPVPPEETFELEEIGFVDPRRIQAIAMEAFGDSNLRQVGRLISDRLDEIGTIKHRLEQTKRVSRQDAENINIALGNQISDKIVMESFSQHPTRINYNLVMEELSTGQTALAAGGAVIGLALIYKLIKWCFNAWNKNQAASGAIGSNIEIITKRKDLLKNGENIIAVSLKSFKQSQSDFKAFLESKENDFGKVLNKEQFVNITRIKNAEQLNDENVAKNYLQAIIMANLGAKFQKHYSKIWQSTITGKPVNGVMFNREFIISMQKAAKGCTDIVNGAMSKIDEIESSSADVTISDDKDGVYQQSINEISNFAKVLNVSNFNGNNFKASASTMAKEIMTLTATDSVPIPDSTIRVDLSFIDDKTFDVASEDFLKDVDDFGKKLNNVSGNNSLADKLKRNTTSDNVNVGDNKQKSSRLAEYQKATNNFQAAMNVMRGILSLRNNIGNGTKAIIESTNILENK